MRDVFEWHVVVPEGTTATATLPFTRRRRELGAGEHELSECVQSG